MHLGYSDPLVEIVLMPERRFKIRPVKTDFKSKDLNPFYGKDFKMYAHDGVVIIVILSMQSVHSIAI